MKTQVFHIQHKSTLHWDLCSEPHSSALVQHLAYRGSSHRRKGAAWHNSYLCTYDLYRSVCNALDAGSIYNEGKWEGWALWLFWALWNGIEPISNCHLGPKKVEPLTRWPPANTASQRGMAPPLSGPKWHSPISLMSFHKAQKSLDFQGQPPPTCPQNGCCLHQRHYARGRINHRRINTVAYSC